jgi:hypothetical protein
MEDAATLQDSDNVDVMRHGGNDEVRFHRCRWGDQTLIFVEVGGITIADEWIECKQLSTREVQTSLLRRRAINMVSDAK